MSDRAAERMRQPTYNEHMSRASLAVVLAAARTPIGTFGGVFKDVSAVDLGTVAAREVLTRSGVAVTDVDDVVMGCVLQAGSGMNVARQVSLKAGLPVTVPAETVNRVCGSGLQAVVHGVESIRGGYATAVLAGGTESMSRRALSAEERPMGPAPGSRRGGGHAPRGRPELRHRVLSHGRHGRGGGQEVRDHPRGTGRVRGREPGARRARARGGAVPGRDRSGAGARSQGSRDPGGPRRASAPGHHRGAPGRAQAGLCEGRHP